MMLLLAAMVLYSIGAVQSTATSLFQCRHSLDNIPVYTPNIPDFYFDSQNANSFSQGGSKSTLTTSENGYTYIFTLPSESSCSGTLTAVEYCYVTQRDIMQDIFILLLLTRGEGSSNFAVDNVLTVQDKPVNDICPSHGSKRYCCNTTIVTNGSHVSSLNNYAFGISTINDQTLPLRFDTDVAQYRVEHFKYNSPDSLFSKGQSFTPANLVNESLFLVRLFIEPDSPEATTETAAPATTILSATTTKVDSTTPPVIMSVSATTSKADMPADTTSEPTTPPFTTSEPGAQAATTLEPDILPSPTPEPDMLPSPTPETDMLPSPTPKPDMLPSPTPKPDMLPSPTPEPDMLPSPTPETDMLPSPTPEPDMLPSPTPEPDMLPSPTPEPDMLPSPTPEPDMLPSPTPEPDMLPSPTPEPDMLPSPTPEPDMLPSPTPEPDMLPSPTSDPDMLPSLTSEPDMLPSPTSDPDMLPSPTSEPDMLPSPTSQPDMLPSPTSQPDMPVTSGSSLVGGAVGGVITFLLVGGALLAVVLAFVVVVLKRKRKAKDDSMDPHNGFILENAIYDGGFDRSLRLDCEYSYAGPDACGSSSVRLELQNVQDNYYAECGASASVSEGTENYEIETVAVPKPEEDIYVVPARDENSLYAQLQGIRIDYLARSSVKLGSVLGSGQFGVVYNGVLKNGEGEEVEVAVKTLKEGSEKEEKVRFLQEAAIMGQFKHHNVVTMYGVVTQGEPVLLVLELLTKGDLRDYLIHMRSGEEGGDVSVDDHTLLSYCRQVASGMAYLSNKAFVHRDLAARNILVSDDDICKIADFGMSRELLDEDYYVSHGGKIPVKWTAPEALYYKKYSTASDVWSFGALMYEIWSVGFRPYNSLTNTEVIKMIDSGYRLPPPPGCPRALYNIMIACWHPVSAERPHFSDVTRQLSLPDPKLLKWSEEDKCVHPEAAKLGADLKCGQELYKDLQTRYRKGVSYTDS